MIITIISIFKDVIEVIQYGMTKEVVKVKHFNNKYYIRFYLGICIFRHSGIQHVCTPHDCGVFRILSYGGFRSFSEHIAAGSPDDKSM